VSAEQKRLLELEESFLGGAKFDFAKHGETVKQMQGLGFPQSDCVEAILATGLTGTEDRIMNAAVEYLFNRPQTFVAKEPATKVTKSPPAPIPKVKEDYTKYSYDAVQQDLKRRETAMKRKQVDADKQLDREIKQWEANVYAFALQAAVANGQTLSKSRMSTLSAIRAERKVTDDLHLVTLAMIGVNAADLTRLQANAEEVDKKITMVDKLIDEKMKTAPSTTTPTAPTKEMLSSILSELSGTECVVCMDGAASTVFFQCMHICVCENCAPSFRNADATCPRCRAPIERVVKFSR